MLIAQVTVQPFPAHTTHLRDHHPRITIIIPSTPPSPPLPHTVAISHTHTHTQRERERRHHHYPLPHYMSPTQRYELVAQAGDGGREVGRPLTQRLGHSLGVCVCVRVSGGGGEDAARVRAMVTTCLASSIWSGRTMHNGGVTEASEWPPGGVNRGLDICL